MAIGIGTGGLGPTQSKINVTPLIDVLLVLLIIFIMVAPALTMAVPSEIPRKADDPLAAEAAEHQLVLHVAADGRLHLNRELLTPQELPEHLQAVFRLSAQERILFLDADQDVAYGRVIEIMDLCREGGVETIGMVPDSIGL